MGSCFTFIDVETPNTRHDRICQIGVVQTDLKGNETFQGSYLVNPECLFSRGNINIHGITARDCQDEPTFIELWESELRDLFDDSVLIAHNSVFDFNVLANTLRSYDIPMPALQIFDTMELCDLGLADACHRFGIQMERHHDALSDALACKDLFWKLSNGHDIRPRMFHPAKQHKPATLTKEECEAISKLSVKLIGFLEGIELDEVIDDDEMTELDEISSEMALTRIPSLLVLRDVVVNVLEDGVVTEDEWGYLMQVCRKLSESTSYCERTVAHQELIGILEGISADGVLVEPELSSLSVWLEWHEELEGADELRSKIEQVLKDGVITKREERELATTMERFINPIEETLETLVEGPSFQDKLFCLSGDFDHGTKKDVEAYIVERGGRISKNVTMKCNYVVVGGGGSCDYAFGNYGTKVKKALVYKEKGCDIEVIGECCIFGE